MLIYSFIWGGPPSFYSHCQSTLLTLKLQGPHNQEEAEDICLTEKEQRGVHDGSSAGRLPSKCETLGRGEGSSNNLIMINKI